MQAPKLRKVLIDEHGNVVTPVKAAPSLKPKLSAPPTTPKTLVRAPKGMKLVRLSPDYLKPTVAGTNGHWLCDRKMDAKEYSGFVYLVHDTLNNKFYIGKKNFRSAAVKTRGKESDWKTYMTSCDALRHVIALHGLEPFKFYVLEQYRFKGSMAFAETWSMMYCETPYHRDMWYNTLVNSLSWPSKEPISARHKERLKAIINGDGHTLPVWKES